MSTYAKFIPLGYSGTFPFNAFSITTIFVVFRVIVVLSIQGFLYDLIVMEVVDWFHVAHPLQPPAVLQLRAHSCKNFHLGRYTMATAIST